MEPFKITVLGSGTSQGVPVIACKCAVCTSTDAKDKRLRSSIMLTINGKNYVIDSGPDFRQQMLRENVSTLDAIIYTHEHKDHIAGMDDVRAFNFIEKRDMQIYCSKNVEKALHREFHYVFEAEKYPGVPRVNIQLISKDQEFSLEEGINVLPIEVMHYKMPVLGFRIGDFAYVTDAKTISENEKKKLKGVKVLILNALRKEEHISHFNLAQALELIEEVQPEKAYLTHISHLFGKQNEIESLLPEHVSVAFDGMKLTVY